MRGHPAHGTTAAAGARRAALAALAATIMLVGAACQRGGGTEGEGGDGGGGGEEVVIGGVGPLSQPGSVLAGQDMQWAMKTAVEDLNADGGVLDRDVRLVFEDTEGRPEAGGAIAQKLVEEDKVVGVVGEYHSSPALAQIPVYTQHGTPFIVVDAYADAITGGDPEDPNLPAQPKSVFRIAPSNSYDVKLHTDWLVQGVKAKKVVQVYEATDYGLGQAEIMKANLGEAGVELAQVQIELNQPDYTPVFSRVAQEHPDAQAVVFSVTGETNFVAVSNAFSAGLLGKGKICVANQSAQDDAAWWRAVPDGVGCVFRVAGPAEYGEEGQRLAERYTEEFGNAPKAWVFESYDAVMLLADAIGRAGSTTSEEVVKALEETSYEGVLGTYEFPYGSANPVPEGEPSWLWHQWPEPAIQLAQYTEKDQKLGDAILVWPPDRQTRPGTAYVQPGS